MLQQHRIATLQRCCIFVANGNRCNIISQRCCNIFATSGTMLLQHLCNVGYDVAATSLQRQVRCCCNISTMFLQHCDGLNNHTELKKYKNIDRYIGFHQKGNTVKFTEHAYNFYFNFRKTNKTIINTKLLVLFL